MKVLVTAFKPFNKEEKNHSEEILKHIENVSKIVLDVCYDKCYSDLKGEFNLDEFDLIIALGEARNRKEMMIERYAYNVSTCKIPDNLGVLNNDKTIINGGKDILETSLNIDKFEDKIKVSTDPGRFVCNNLYYHLLYNYPSKSLFIHVPNCIENEYLSYALAIMEIIKTLIC